MKNLEIDLETYSSVDLSKCGVYKYAEADDFEILLFGYSIDGGEAKVVDLAAGERIPKDVLDALTDDSVTKWAFNAAFERICLSRYLSNTNRFCNNRPLSKECTRYLNPKSWKCSMIWSAYLGLPLSLETVGMVLGLEKQKLSEGKKLIRYFCMPCKPTKANGGRTRNLFFHDKEKWKCFKAYNIRDVETEMQIQKKLQKYPVPDFVWEEYHLDQEINDQGIAIDITFVEQAIAMDKRSKTVLTNTLKKLTELNNPNSVVQMKQWLLDNGIEMESLGKKEVDEALKTAPEHLKEILYVRQQLAKSSVKKYQAMQNAACADHRARGMFQFYGANRSGRWAGRIIQLQNLYRNSLPDLEVARELVRSGDFETVELLFDSVPEVLSELIRTAFVPKDGCKFIVSDFSAVEARVLSYLANETWRTEVFAQGKDIYCASASQMFGVPVEKHGVNSNLRQKGKIAELALGYGGSVGALKAMGALEMGLAEEELQPLVDAWRQSNPNIVKFWWDVDRCVKKTVKKQIPTETNGIKFRYQSGMLFILLPSGRQLSYVKPRMGENRFGGEAVTYEGIGGTKKWERIESYGPKFVENIVQAYSRDLLAHSMRALERCSIVAHIHDEIIIEADMCMSEKVLSEQMSRVPPWAEGLLLRAEGYETFFYKKD